jgi:hypothetical protein
MTSLFTMGTTLPLDLAAVGAAGGAGVSGATAGAMGATALGGLISAAGTLLGGSMSRQAANYQAAQLRQNAVTARAQVQRGAMDEQLKASMLSSSAVARAAAGGVNAGFGSPVTNVGEIAGRGEYQALTTMARGENEARGLEAEASGLRYSGNAAMLGAGLAAAGTIAGGDGSTFRTYGGLRWAFT